MSIDNSTEAQQRAKRAIEALSFGASFSTYHRAFWAHYRNEAIGAIAFLWRKVIQDHPDYDKRPMQWCEHLNVHEVSALGTGVVLYICEDCGDSCYPSEAEEWMPKLIGTLPDG